MQHGTYYCTWNAQNFGRPDAALEKSPAVFLGAEGAKRARNYLNEEHIFQSGGLADQYEGIRGDLYFLMDDGWDVPYDVHPDTQITSFGSLMLSEERFPSFQGTPEQRLRKLNEAFQKKGWKGIGLWVAAHALGESPETGYLSKEESVQYWGERMRWCREAGVEYWKVDWGFHQFDPVWREMLNDLRDRIMPSLQIEHCHPAAAPVNHVVFRGGRQISDGRFQSWEDYPERWSKILENSEIFRSYDVLAQFSQVSTVDRLAALMERNPQAGAVINCEDEVYLGAVLGCSLGIMRSNLCKEIPVFRFDPQQNSRKIDEVLRAVNWQKLAPAFPIREGRLTSSRETVRETYVFHEGETWMEEYIGREIFQECPQVVARNMELPQITYLEMEKPVIAACRHPNGAVSAVAMPRSDGKGGYRTPKAGIMLSGIRTGTPIGIFGKWDSVSLKGQEDFREKRLFVRDLKEKQEREITRYIVRQEHRMDIPMNAAWNMGEDCGADLSAPGLAFVIR